MVGLTSGPKPNGERAKKNVQILGSSLCRVLRRHVVGLDWLWQAASKAKMKLFPLCCLPDAYLCVLLKRLAVLRSNAT